MVAIDPLGPTKKAPPPGKVLTALNPIPDFFGGLIRVGSLGGRKSKINLGATRKRRT
jgi:hypothetical protein